MNTKGSDKDAVNISICGSCDGLKRKLTKAKEALRNYVNEYPHDDDAFEKAKKVLEELKGENNAS